MSEPDPTAAEPTLPEPTEPETAPSGDTAPMETTSADAARPDAESQDTSPPAAPSPPRRTLRRVEELVEAGLADPAEIPRLRRVSEKLSLAITPEMVAAMENASPDDPLFLQFVPSTAELTTTAEELADPIGDERFSPLKGITHRYPDRLLLKPIHVCPVYCRFCFRREKVGRGAEALSEAELEAALGYVRDHPEVWEVILTGGDPLMLSPRRLAALVARLDAVPHVAVIRVHSRVPVSDPERITEEAVRALRPAGGSHRTAVYVGVHTNHPRELTPAALAALDRLADAGIPLLSQTVLLRGVNDDPAVLEELLRTLVRHRVKPYYLHHPDLVPGTSDFRLTLEEGRRIVEELRGRVSGLCQPTYVLDVPGGYGKVPVGPGYVETVQADGRGEDPGDAEPTRYRVRDVHGRWHAYPPRAPDDAD